MTPSLGLVSIVMVAEFFGSLHSYGEKSLTAWLTIVAVDTVDVQRNAGALQQLLPLTLDRVPQVTLVLTYASTVEASNHGRGERHLAFQMLDALLRETPFDEWEQ